MTQKNDTASVEAFLNDFRVKWNIYGILFRDDRGKNHDTLTALEIRPIDREKVLKSLTVEDFSEGPLDDTLYKGASMWVFGKALKNQEIYIKITMGFSQFPAICISFHLAEYPMRYPFK